jgi:hypothetical protein
LQWLRHCCCFLCNTSRWQLCTSIQNSQNSCKKQTKEAIKYITVQPNTIWCNTFHPWQKNTHFIALDSERRIIILSCVKMWLSAGSWIRYWIYWPLIHTTCDYT